MPTNDADIAVMTNTRSQDDEVEPISQDEEPDEDVPKNQEQTTNSTEATGFESAHESTFNETILENATSSSNQFAVPTSTPF